MTTGLIEVGSLSTHTIYYLKAWSGGDGHTSENQYVADIVTRERGRSRLVPYPDAPPAFYADGSAALPLIWGANDTIKLHGKVGDFMRGHKFNMGVALAEGQESSRTVMNAAKGIAKSLRSLKKGRPDDAVRHLARAFSDNRKAPSKKAQNVQADLAIQENLNRLQLTSSYKDKVKQAARSGGTPNLTMKDVSSQWLAIQYGWKPIMNDVKNAADAFEQIAKEPRTRKKRISHSIRTSGNSSASPSGYTGHGRRRITKRLQIVVTEDLSSAPRSLGLLNPASIAWELVPFSFVADWFIPVGSYLDAVSAIPPHFDVFVTEGVKDVFTGTVGEGDIKDKLLYNGSGFFDKYKAVHVERNPGVGLNTPAPEFEDLSDAYSSGRAKNAVALIHQLFT